MREPARSTGRPCVRCAPRGERRSQWAIGRRWKILTGKSRRWSTRWAFEYAGCGRAGLRYSPPRDPVPRRASERQRGGDAIRRASAHASERRIRVPLYAAGGGFGVTVLGLESGVHSPQSTVHRPQSTVHRPQSTGQSRSGWAVLGLGSASCSSSTAARVEHEDEEEDEHEGMQHPTG